MAAPCVIDGTCRQGPLVEGELDNKSGGIPAAKIPDSNNLDRQIEDFKAEKKNRSTDPGSPIANPLEDYKDGLKTIETYIVGIQQLKEGSFKQEGVQFLILLLAEAISRGNWSKISKAVAPALKKLGLAKNQEFIKALLRTNEAGAEAALALSPALKLGNPLAKETITAAQAEAYVNVVAKADYADLRKQIVRRAFGEGLSGASLYLNSVERTVLHAIGGQMREHNLSFTEAFRKLYAMVKGAEPHDYPYRSIAQALRIEHLL